MESIVPHLVIKGSDQLLGVNFIDSEDVTFDKSIRANALPVNEDIDYSALQAVQSSLLWKVAILLVKGL